MNQSARLTITKNGDTYSFRLDHPSERPDWAGIRKWEVTVDPRAIDALQSIIRRVVLEAHRRPDGPGAGIEPFVQFGRGLFDCVLAKGPTRDLRQALDELKTPLLIVTDDPDLPWELLTASDKDGFFCVKYDLGRSLLMVDVPSSWASRNRQKWRCLIIADPNVNLPSAAEEARNLRSWLEAKDIECDYLEGPDATYEAVFEKLLTEYDIIHYAGHATRDALDVHGGSYSSQNIRTFVKGSPIVFLNGCESALAVGGLADAFISTGARVVVGSMFDAPDDGAREFAEKFYQVILSGQPLGEAMRMARSHVMGRPDWGAAWACFVMYGDPCLRIELKVDELQAALRQIELSRNDFDSPSGRLLQKAIAYGASRGGVDTAHLFAAMVGGENSFLRNRLREREIPPDALEEAFQQVFKAMEGTQSAPATPAGAIRFSPNTQAMLKLAKESAQGSDSSKISELDLIRGFVRKDGGRTGEILKGLGVKVEELDPDRAASSAPALLEPTSDTVSVGPVSRVGSLSPPDCSPEAWQSLLAAVDLASRSGSPVVGTPHLFAGLLQDPRGALASALRRLSLPLSAGRWSSAPGTALGGDVACTENTGNILLEAQADAAAAGGLVTDRHLLGAFVRSGGGHFGEVLARQGLAVEALASDLFLEGGDLDLAQFDHNARAILETAVEYARRKHHGVFSRQHVVYGALTLPASVLAQGVRSQGRDPELLADQMSAEMENGTSRSLLKATLRTMSASLISTLCRAEAEARERSGQLIDEPILLRAWLSDGGGQAASFLARNGVKLRTLVAS